MNIHFLDVLYFIYPFTYWRISCFLPQVSATMKVTTNIRVLYAHKVLTALYNYQRAWLLYFRERIYLVLLRNWQTVFQGGCSTLHFHRKRMRVPVALHFHQHLVWSVFWILAILSGIWYFIIVLICNSVMTYNVEILSAYLPSVHLLWYAVCYLGLLFDEVVCFLRSKF